MDDESRRALERDAMAGGWAEREAFTRATLASGCGRVLVWVPAHPARALYPRIGEVRAKATVGGASGVVLAVAVADLDDMTSVASRISRQLVLVVLEEAVGYVGFGAPPWAIRVEPYEGEGATGIVGALPRELRESLGGDHVAADLLHGMGDFIPPEGVAAPFPAWIGGPPAPGSTTGGALVEPLLVDAMWVGDPPPGPPGTISGPGTGTTGPAPGVYLGTAGWVSP